MPLSIEDWDFRFRQQAQWTAAMRQYLLKKYAPARRARLLEVGCGTGAVAAPLVAPSYGYANNSIWGIDLNLGYLRLARRAARSARWVGADALRLPFRPGSFDLVFCHFFLLWVPQPELALAEMVRVTARGGAVIAFAEPDYGGRIDYPPPLEELGRMQEAALRGQGADPRIGRRLSELFHRAGLREVEVHLLGGQWSQPPTPEQQESEWQVLRADLGERLSPEQMENLRQIDAAAWQTGQRILYVPTFSAAGRKA